MDGTAPYMDIFSNILQKPIQRGRNKGIVGDGWQTGIAWEIFKEMQQENRDLSTRDWDRMNVNIDQLEEWEVSGMLEDGLPKYYECPICLSHGRDSFL